MSSISIKTATDLYGGQNEQETVQQLARAGAYQKIYKYANHYGNQETHTDYKRIHGGLDEEEFLCSSHVHNIVLVYVRTPSLRL
jgi:hypothetical protein